MKMSKRRKFLTVTYHGQAFENYKINCYGEIYNTKTNKKLKTNASGTCPYPVIRVRTEEGKTKSLLVHRIVCELFVPLTLNDKTGILKTEWKKTPKSVKAYIMRNMYVNHKDHDKNNFSYKNLEWVTAEENAVARNKHYGI